MTNLTDIRASHSAPGCMILGESFARVNGADGKAFCRASLTASGSWLLRASPASAWREVDESTMKAAMASACITVALS